MDKQLIHKQLTELTSLYKKTMPGKYLAIVASIDGMTTNYSNYDKGDSVITCFMSRKEIESKIVTLQNDGVYVELFTDAMDFATSISNNNIPFVVHESSPKGIGRGRDALLPSLCDCLLINHMGPDAATNAIFTSKYNWISTFASNNIPVPKTCLYSKNKWLDRPTQGEKVILKLNNECASIGLSKDSVMVYDGVNCDMLAKKLYSTYSQPILAQQFISGYEVEIPIIANKNATYVLPPIGLSHKGNNFFENEFFDYNEIFDYNYSLYDFSEVAPKIAEQLIFYAEKVAAMFDIEGYFRMDCRIDNKENIYYFDVNNDPDLSVGSSYNKAFEILGFKNEDIIKVLLGNALLRRPKFNICK